MRLQNHDVNDTVVARATVEEIEVVRKSIAWRFTWVSSYHSDFNYDFYVPFLPEGAFYAHYLVCNGTIEEHHDPRSA